MTNNPPVIITRNFNTKRTSCRVDQERVRAGEVGPPKIVLIGLPPWFRQPLFTITREDAEKACDLWLKFYPRPVSENT